MKNKILVDGNELINQECLTFTHYFLRLMSWGQKWFHVECLLLPQLLLTIYWATSMLLGTYIFHLILTITLWAGITLSYARGNWGSEKLNVPFRVRARHGTQIWLWNPCSFSLFCAIIQLVKTHVVFLYIFMALYSDDN